MTRSLLSLIALFLAAPAFAQGGLANLKIVTDANPDYSDMESMVRSITLNQKTDADKMWALFYWDHIARRHTYQPMRAHGVEITDPIRQFNDYGYTYFASAAGIKCSEWNYMGYPCRYFGGISDVWYDGKFHAYDNAWSAIWTLEDGKTIASVEDFARAIAGPETNNKPVPGYLILYRALNATSPRGYLQGSDTDRSLAEIAQSHAGAKSSYYNSFYNQERGHRYILNLRPGEIYTRYYTRQDTRSPHAVVWDQNGNPSYKSDPAYFVHNGLDHLGNPSDPEALYSVYHLRGTGDRAFTPPLDDGRLASSLHSSANIKATGLGLTPAAAGAPAVAVFKIEGANVITSLKLRAMFSLATADDTATISLSTTNGAQWTELWKSTRKGDDSADLRVVEPVNGVYEALVKVTLSAKAASENALLKSISFDTLTQINSKTQPQLHLGANTVYVGVGEQTDSIVVWPDLRDRKYEPYLADEQNIAVAPFDTSHQGIGIMQPAENKPAWVTFKVDAPTDITGFTFGGRFSNRGAKSRIELLHSFDGGKTWKKDYGLDQPKLPSDTIHFESLRDVPAGNRSVLFKYALYPDAGPTNCSIYSVRMEVNHRLAPAANPPLEVTFHWLERQKDYSLAPRSHTQLVEKFPFTYNINVGGEDHPIVESLAINYKGQRPDVTYGYSHPDQVPQNPARWIGNWETVGNNLALGKPYTLSRPSGDFWGSGDPRLKKLTDGVVGSSFGGGNRFIPAAAWNSNLNPEITVDMGSIQKCAAFRIQTLGWEPWDALRGENKDNIEVFTSPDGKTYTSAGKFNFELRFKDIPVNYMLPDEETLRGFNYVLPLDTPIEARYVRYKITTARISAVTEVQVLDSYTLTPFDLRIALPDPATNGQRPPNADVSPNAKKFEKSELPAIGQPLR